MLSSLQFLFFFTPFCIKIESKNIARARTMLNVMQTSRPPELHSDVVAALVISTGYLFVCHVDKMFFKLTKALCAAPYAKCYIHSARKFASYASTTVKTTLYLC